jgi:hypothetical protein
MAIIRIETDQPISSITINFAHGPAGEVTLSTDDGNSRPSVARPEPINSGHEDGPTRREKDDWHSQNDREIEEALQSGNVHSLDTDFDDEPPIDLSEAGDMSVGPAKVVEAPVLPPSAPVADRPPAVDPSMASASF